MKNVFMWVAVIVLIVLAFYYSRDKDTMTTQFEFSPISHATLMLQAGGKTIITDPVGELSLYEGLPEANIILVTDIHGDHFNEGVLKALAKENTAVVMPQVVADKLTETLPGKLVVMNNGDVVEEQGFSIEAIPMYNIPESEDAYHIKGRGNGYVVEKGDQRVYISGDTSGVPEMRALKDIDLAFVCMNLPYTMTVDEAAEAVLAFKPKVVVPYHYRGSDTAKFKELVNAGDPNIQVNLVDFYKQ